MGSVILRNGKYAPITNERNAKRAVKQLVKRYGLLPLYSESWVGNQLHIKSTKDLLDKIR